MAVFHFKRFDIDDHGCGMKICSDSVLLAAWFLPPYSHCHKVADIGAGSGILSLLAADIMPRAEIEAVEIDTDAAYAAKKNFEASPWSGRLNVVNEDFSQFKDHSGPFDIVISNPPYFTTGEQSSDSSRAKARHQQMLSYATLLCSDILSAGGHMGLVSPAEYENEIIYHAELNGMKLRRLCRVMTAAGKKPSRLLWDFSNIDGNIEEHLLQLRNSDGSYTDDYRRITEPYYMRL